MKDNKHIQSFEKFNEKLNIFDVRNSKKVILNDYTILNFIQKSRGKLKKILKLISEKLTQEYITLYHEDCKDVIDSLKSFGFDIKIYDDSNEYSENFDDKIKISWKCDFKNTISDDDYSGE
ncbi:MAG: hypothetical protein WDA02_03450 [Saccharofermentanales bacterium]